MYQVSWSPDWVHGRAALTINFQANSGNLTTRLTTQIEVADLTGRPVQTITSPESSRRGIKQRHSARSIPGDLRTRATTRIEATNLTGRLVQTGSSPDNERSSTRGHKGRHSLRSPDWVHGELHFQSILRPISAIGELGRPPKLKLPTSRVVPSKSEARQIMHAPPRAATSGGTLKFARLGAWRAALPNQFSGQFRRLENSRRPPELNAADLTGRPIQTGSSPDHARAPTRSYKRRHSQGRQIGCMASCISNQFSGQFRHLKNSGDHPN
ncbi:hypothetical protein O6P43_016148 [Quillaja saponaria]|uniref:Uncharacterized protein n=1 Tax=Quillaja saponaria TaxID=32244 RepID=A0AAD7LYN7_QUISA|nr:hypothetical protein O6P43_016148 [Quillaja saponaria]